MGRLKVIAAVVLTLVLLGTMGFFLTKDSNKADHTAEETMLEIKTNQTTSERILEKNKSNQLTACFNQYYAQKTQDEEFADEYDAIVIYTLSAQKKGDYIAFVTYQMKIKDVTTLLPGMESFYVEQTESGTYQIADTSLNPSMQDEIESGAETKEVQELIQKVEDDYTKAIQSDPELQTALDELQKAYQ